MDMSLIGRLGIIFKYIFSSFLTIEMFMLSLLLLCILIYNLKVKNEIINIAAIGIYIGFLFGILVTYSDYIGLCIRGFIKAILNYIYFPSTFVYFLIFAFVTGLMIYTIFNKKMKKIKKLVNYICFSILYFLFMSFVVLSVYSGIDMNDVVLLYKNDLILSLVQISNLLFIVWILFTFFYELYQFFKRKYD